MLTFPACADLLDVRPIVRPGTGFFLLPVAVYFARSLVLLSLEAMFDPSSRRLVLFGPQAGPRYRRLRIGAAGVLLLLILAVTAPVYPLFSRIEPMVLGFPLAFAWVIGAILVSFAALLVLFLNEDASEER